MTKEQFLQDTIQTIYKMVFQFDGYSGVTVDNVVIENDEYVVEWEEYFHGNMTDPSDFWSVEHVFTIPVQDVVFPPEEGDEPGELYFDEAQFKYDLMDLLEDRNSQEEYQG